MKGDMVLVDSTSSSNCNSQGNSTSPPGICSGDNTPKAEHKPRREATQPPDQGGKQPTESTKAVPQQPEPAASQPADQSASKSTSKSGESDSPRLRVLVAEDDPINAKILQKRLGKLGYTVKWTVNGEECANAYAEAPTQWDVVLMDIQMPILDGMDSTKRIREFEKQNDTSSKLHVPVFAVSASLLEKDAQMYVDLGFDGWIMKPINFERLSTLLAGIRQEHVRNGAVYQPGQWEKGGWFTMYTGS